EEDARLLVPGTGGALRRSSRSYLKLLAKYGCSRSRCVPPRGSRECVTRNDGGRRAVPEARQLSRGSRYRVDVTARARVLGRLATLLPGTRDQTRAARYRPQYCSPDDLVSLRGCACPFSAGRATRHLKHLEMESTSGPQRKPPDIRLMDAARPRSST